MHWACSTIAVNIFVNLRSGLANAAIPGIGIQLLGKRGARRIIRLDPMTGYPRVEGVTPS